MNKISIVYYSWIISKYLLNTIKTYGSWDRFFVHLAPFHFIYPHFYLVRIGNTNTLLEFRTNVIDYIRSFYVIIYQPSILLHEMNEIFGCKDKTFKNLRNNPKTFPLLIKIWNGRTLDIFIRQLFNQLNLKIQNIWSGIGRNDRFFKNRQLLKISKIVLTSYHVF